VEGRVFVKMVSNYSTKDDEYIHENLRIAGVPASVRSGYFLNKRTFGHI
jgi:hypothetical protein